MLFLAKNQDEQFYINPEDAKRYADNGYEIIDIDTKRCLTAVEISELKPVTLKIQKG
jgi:hypothetical protein